MTHVEHATRSEPLVAHRLDAAVWGLFFVWVGIALIAHVGWGLGLLGVGLITLGAQIARKNLGLATEGFWIVAGSFFVLGGIWELLSVRFSLVPLVLVAAGVALLVSALRRPKA